MLDAVNARDQGMRYSAGKYGQVETAARVIIHKARLHFLS
jgi:hypothetical protein